MRVSEHHLCYDDGTEVMYEPTPNHGGELVAPRCLLIHYTAGRGFEQSRRWLCNPKARASAHLVVGSSGELAQLVKFDRIAWHAGASEWDGRERLNEWSIGIELDNAGKLIRTAAGWATWYGHPVPADDVVIADGAGWHRFYDVQIQAAYEACEALMDAYPSLELVLGHSDVAPRRKVDPGPAFPMELFRSWLTGRGEG